MVTIGITLGIFIFLCVVVVVVYVVYDNYCDVYDDRHIGDLMDKFKKNERGFWDKGFHSSLKGYSLPSVTGWEPELKSIPGGLAILVAARNVDKCLAENLRRLADIGSQFTDFTIYVYENDSKDQTGAILDEWSTTILPDNMVVSQNKWSDADKALPWLTRMQLVRHHMKQHFHENYRDEKHVLVYDIDLIGGLHPRSIEQIFKDKTLRWDALFTNGISYKHLHGPRKWVYYLLGVTQRAYDSLAFEGLDGKGIKNPRWTTTRKKIDLCNNERVNSTFGGAALYTIDAFSAGDYMAVVNSNLCEHRIFHKSIAKKGFKYMYLSRHMVAIR